MTQARCLCPPLRLFRLGETGQGGARMDWPEHITQAAQRIDGYVRQTPVMQIDVPGVKNPVSLKLEHLQHTGSFKARGAFNTLLSGPVPKAGIVAASGGNHGAAVAYAARQLGHPARIYVPEIAGPAKIALIRDLGADLVVVPGAYAQAAAQALEWQQNTGAMQIHAYDAPATVAGQGTLFREWQSDQGLRAETLVVAVGGGGLLAGAMGWFQGQRRILAVEPTGAPTLHTALRQGPDAQVDVGGVAANALGARQIGRICYDLAQQQGVAPLLVGDDEIIQAQTWLWRNARLLVEPAGAAALAALMAGHYTPSQTEHVAVLLCGANVAPDPLAAVVG